MRLNIYRANHQQKSADMKKMKKNKSKEFMMYVDQMPNQPLSVEELKTLDKFLRERGLSVFQVHGLLCGIVSGSEDLPMEAGLVIALGESLNTYSNEIRQMLNLASRLNRQIAGELIDAERFFPMVDYERIDKFNSKNLNALQKLRLSLWCFGYAYAISLDANSWIEQKLHKKYVNLLSKLNRLMIELAYEGRREQSGKLEKLLSKNQELIESLPMFITAVYSFWNKGTPIN